MPLKLDITVAAIAEDNGRFLFVQERAARRVVLNQPAGHVEDGESLVDAVIREAREETACEFRPDSLTGLYLWQGPAGRTVLRVAFAGRAGERAAGMKLDRAILRTLWLWPGELAARAAEHRSQPQVVRVAQPLRRAAQLPELWQQRIEGDGRADDHDDRARPNALHPGELSLRRTGPLLHRSAQVGQELLVPAYAPADGRRQGQGLEQGQGTGDRCGAHTFPYIELGNSSSTVEHEASTRKISEEQLFYCKQRGLSGENAVSMIVNGFCKEVFKNLPMEFAVEASRLLGVSLEGSVG